MYMCGSPDSTFVALTLQGACLAAHQITLKCLTKNATKVSNELRTNVHLLKVGLFNGIISVLKF